MLTYPHLCWAKHSRRFFYDEWFIEGPLNSRLLFQCLEIMLLERQAWKFCKAKSEMQKKHYKLELPIEKKVGDIDRHNSSKWKRWWCAENFHNNTTDTVMAWKCWPFKGPLGLWEDKSSFPYNHHSYQSSRFGIAGPGDSGRTNPSPTSNLFITLLLLHLQLIWTLLIAMHYTLSLSSSNCNYL